MRSYIANKKVKKKRCNYEILIIEEIAEKCYKVRNVKKDTEYLVLIIKHVIVWHLRSIIDVSIWKQLNSMKWIMNY